MTSVSLSEEERSAILDHAELGLNQLISWAQQSSTDKSLPTNVTTNYEACRLELDMKGAGTIQDIVSIYRNPDDEAGTAAHIHLDQCKQLGWFKSRGIHVSLCWGIFKAPVIWHRDRDVVYLDCSKKFIDPFGRCGFARYLSSYTSGTSNHSYVRADLRMWGVVFVETCDPEIIHASSIVDIDWKGGLAYCAGESLTSRLAQSVKHLSNVVRQSKKLENQRCAMCANKAKCEIFVPLKPCSDCKQPLCENCRKIGMRLIGAPMCLSCANIHKQAHMHSMVVSEASTAESIGSDELESPLELRRDKENSGSKLCVHCTIFPMVPITFSQAEQDAMVNDASENLNQLIAWAIQTPQQKITPKTTTRTYEVCRCELHVVPQINSIVDTIAALYTTEDACVIPNTLPDKFQTLFSLNDGEIQTKLCWGFFRGNLPWIQDRDATYLASSKTFVDQFGRHGFAYLMKSHHVRNCPSVGVRAHIWTWGAVFIQSNDPSIVYASSLVDIDWKGNLVAGVAARMTSRRAQSIKQLPAHFYQINDQPRCTNCFRKTMHFDCLSELKPCIKCLKLFCVSCRSKDKNFVFNGECTTCHEEASIEDVSKASTTVDLSYLSELFVKAADGIQNLIEWSEQHTDNIAALKSPTWAYEYYRHRLNLPESMDIDDLIQLYREQKDVHQGVVLQSTESSSVVIATSMVDVDWKGNMASALAMYLTSTAARNIQNLSTLARQLKKKDLSSSSKQLDNTLHFGIFMTAAIVDSFERNVILKKASGGIEELINWAQQTPEGKLLPKTTNWTFEACRWELELNGEGTFDDVITLYKNPDDVSATMNYIHVDKSQELFPLEAPGMDISLRWGIFRAPLPFMRDRCATYIEYTKEFIDHFGRRGFARYIRSHALGSIDPRYVRTEIRSWGVVIVETMDPSVLHVSSTVDIDWNGNMPTWVSALMTSRRAQSIKNLANVLRASRKLIQKRCGVCATKPSFLGRQLVHCHDCTKPICGDCRSHHSHTPGASSCWGCVSDRSKMFYHEVRFHSKSIVAQEGISPEKFPSFGPTRYSQSTTWPSIVDDLDNREPPVDLSYLPDFNRQTT
ncbi:hypothetical protein THRCLA_04304 [Thraustotheca clavata]|uniref:START domain-containing protein n=1 Tax=Thraustotheca clavata TaxID=74557 RepID=A0A1V9ZZE9_9STRA|nr:hypothetical protein THRCLA_04304 [Thraustotheca clavata]